MVMYRAHFENPFPQASDCKNLNKHGDGFDTHYETEGYDQEGMIGDDAEGYKQAPEEMRAHITHENTGRMCIMPEKTCDQGKACNACRPENSDRVQ